MILAEDEQRLWKRRILAESLERVGKFRDLPIAELVASPQSLAYRNKIEFALGGSSRGRRLGLHRALPATGIVDLERCLLIGERPNSILGSAREFFLKGEGKLDPVLDAGGDRFRLVVREGRASRQLAVAFRHVPGPFPTAQAAAAFLRERHPDLRGVARIEAVPGRRGGARLRVLEGSPIVDETLAGTRFELPVYVFFQINTEAAEGLSRDVAASAGAGTGKAIDLYGGVGTFAIGLARKGFECTVVEADPAAVLAGRQAVARARLEGVRFVAAGAGAFLKGLGRGARYDLVVADPPRTGLGPGVAEELARLGAPRILMVSCDPPTLARDLRRLGAFGYALERVIPFDLFPQTPHVESVAILSR
jgi:23S rRNA (uracil1939-C5)-methyltransferase